MSSRSPVGRRARVPLDRVAAAPVSVGLGAVGERGAQHLAGVVRRAADLRHVPVRAEVGGAHLRVGLEAARGEHDRARAQLLRAPSAYRTTTPGRRRPPRAGGPRPRRRGGARSRRAPRRRGAAPSARRRRRRCRPRARPRTAGARRPRWPGARTSAGSAGPCPRSQRTASRRVADQHARHRRVAAPERDAPQVGGEVLGAVRVEVGGREPLVGLDDVAARPRARRARSGSRRR